MMFTLHVLGVLAGVSLTREADEGQSDAAAYVSFLGQRLDNHSYVDWDNVGSDESNSVQCRTQLHACCSRFQGLGRGDWYAPGGVKLNFVSGDGGYQSREPQRVDIRYDKKHPVMSGVYRCDIATNTPRGLMMQKIYIGLYSGNSGDVTIPDRMSVTSSGGQFTLTCISTGGPATTVTWSRDSTPLSAERYNINTQLVDPVQARYIHTLTLTQPLGESVYTCSVSNNKPSLATAELSAAENIESEMKVDVVQSVEDSGASHVSTHQTTTSQQSQAIHVALPLQTSSTWILTSSELVLAVVFVYCMYRLWLRVGGKFFSYR